MGVQINDAVAHAGPPIGIDQYLQEGVVYGPKVLENCKGAQKKLLLYDNEHKKKQRAKDVIRE